MSTPQISKRLPLDPSLYKLEAKELSFFKTQTGIQEDGELKQHILDVQAEAYEVFPYPCIRRFAFVALKIAKYPSYDHLLKLGKERPGAILLDLGCCMGSDTRKAVADGYPPENIVASDIKPEFWSLGHKLFKSTQESYPVKFIPGDIFDPEFIATDASPAPTSNTSLPPAPSLTGVTSLTQLQHHISAIHTSSFFHLFSEQQQRHLAHLLGSLLSPLPGSIIFGSHMGIPDTEENKRGGTRFNGRGMSIFAHSASSWEAMWVGERGVFKPGDVILSTTGVEVERKDVTQAGGPAGYKATLLVWSVTRA